MVAWINFASLIVALVMFLLFYIKSVSPAAMEKKIGEIAYKRAGQYRLVASILMFVIFANYILYYFYPLPLPFPKTFAWGWTISIVIGVFITLLGGSLMYRGIKDAGEETMTPKKSHTLYGGIYNYLRHPQALGEVAIWWAVAFFLNSPFLVIWSFLFIPIYALMCFYEEKDLIIRYGETYRNYRDNTGFFIPRKGSYD